MLTQNLLEFSQKELKSISFDSYRESVWVLSYVLNIPSGHLYFKEHASMDEKQEKKAREIIKKRKKGWPLSYLLNETFFMNKKFFIKPGVFIPRKESDLIVTHGKKIKKSPLKFLDLGAGAGTLCLSLLEERPDSQCVAVEISLKSLECLSYNANQKKLNERIKILKKDVSKLRGQDVTSFLKGEIDLIVANPPYIKPHDQNLEQGVYLFEPPLALFSDQEGMGHIFSWFYKAMELLPSQGRYIFEFGYDQSQRVKAFLDQQKEIKSYHLYKDDENRDRIAYCIKK